MMEMDVSYLMISLILGTIGLAYFVYGKRQEHIAALVCGLLLLGIPYMSPNVTSLTVFGTIIAALPWLLRALGY